MTINDAALHALLTSVETEENDLSLEIIKEDSGIDLKKIHCTKTGQPIASRDDLAVSQMMQFYNVAKLSDLAPHINLASGISPIWIKTDPTSLNRLEIIDPRGAFCFYVGIALRAHHQVYIDGKRIFATTEVQRTFQNSLVKLWYLTGEFPIQDIIDANKNMRTFMMLDLHNSKFYRIPWQILRSDKIDPSTRVICLHSKRMNGLDAQALRISPQYQEEAILPEEFGTSHAMNWIKFVLDKTLERISRRKQLNEETYRNLHLASAFKSGNNIDIIAEMIGRQHIDTNATRGKNFRAIAQKIEEQAKQKYENKAVTIAAPKFSMFKTAEPQKIEIPKTEEQKPATIRIRPLIKKS